MKRNPFVSKHGLRDQIDRGCPRCGGLVDPSRDSKGRRTIVCLKCNEAFHAASGMPADLGGGE